MAKRFRNAGLNSTISSNSWIPDFINQLGPPTTEIPYKVYASSDHRSLGFFRVTVSA